MRDVVALTPVESAVGRRTKPDVILGQVAEELSIAGAQLKFRSSSPPEPGAPKSRDIRVRHFLPSFGSVGHVHCDGAWGHHDMILPALTAIPLLILTAATPDSDLVVGPSAHLSSQQRSAAVQPFISRATECVARSVAANPRSSDASQLGELIVDSMPPCADVMRSMIATYDDYFGEGTGEAFFSGPYLNVLPMAISKWVAQHRR